MTPTPRNPPSLGWAVVLPVKRLQVAKSRLRPLAPELRRHLALAFALDTIAVACRCTDVRHVVVVTDEPAVGPAALQLGARVVPDEPQDGLNAALRHGVEATIGWGHEDAVAALSADLPALVPADLSLALSAARAHGRAFVADHHGTGTTLLCAARAESFDPHFGPHSAAAHAQSGAAPLAVRVPRLRLDVDTLDDLRSAFRAGVGLHTAAAVQDAGLALGRR